MEQLGSFSESLTLSEIGNNSSIVEVQVDQFVVGLMGPSVNRKDLEALVVQQQVSDILRANNDIIAVKQFRITNEKMYKDKELAAIRRKEIHEPLTQALTQVEILEERIGRRDQLIDQLRRQIAMLNIERRENHELITQRNHQLMNSNYGDHVKAEQLKDEIVMLQRKAETDTQLIVRCRKTIKGQQDKIKSLSQLNEKIEFHFKERVKQLEAEKASLGSLADSKDAKIEQLVEARDFLNQHHMDLQAAMDDAMSQLREAKATVKEQGETIASMEGEANILARNLKETLELYHEKNEEWCVLSETTADLQTRYDDLIKEMDRMVAIGFNLAPKQPAAPQGDVVYVEEGGEGYAGSRSRTSSSAHRKKRASRGASMRVSINPHPAEGRMSFTDETPDRPGSSGASVAVGGGSILGSVNPNNAAILQGIKEAQAAVAAEEAKDQQHAHLMGMFATRKEQQDKHAKELRAASAAMRAKDTMENTISDLMAKLAEEKARGEEIQRTLTEANVALEARRKEEVVALHQKSHKHERQFHTMSEMLSLETAKVQRLEAELEHLSRQHDTAMEAHLQYVDQVKEEQQLMTRQRSSGSEDHLVKAISGQFIDLGAGPRTPAHEEEPAEEEPMDFNDSAVLSRKTSSVAVSEHPEVDEPEPETLVDELEEEAIDREYDMFAYMLSWKNVQLNSKGTETMIEEPKVFHDAGVQFTLNKEQPQRLAEKQCQTVAMEAIVESYLDVLFSDFIMLSRKSVPSVGALANESDKFVMQNYGFALPPGSVPQGAVTRLPFSQQSQTADSSPTRRSNVITPHQSRPMSPKTPSVGSTRPTSPVPPRPMSPKPPSPPTIPAEPASAAAPVAHIPEEYLQFLGSESDVIFRHRRAINYLANLNDIRNLAVRDLNRLPVGGTLNSRVLIRSIDIFLQTLHILLSNATNEPVAPKPVTVETSDYAELLRTVDTEHEQYDDELGEGYREGVEERISDRIANPQMFGEDRPLSVHRPRTGSVQDTFKLTQTVLTTADTAAGARRGLLSPGNVVKPKVHRTYMNRDPSPRKVVPDVDTRLEREHQIELARSRQNSPERARQSDSEAAVSGDEIHYQPAEVSEEEEEYTSDFGSDRASIRERNAAAINKYYNFNREKSFLDRKTAEAAMRVPGSQFHLLVDADEEHIPMLVDDEISIRSPVLLDAQPPPEPPAEEAAGRQLQQQQLQGPSKPRGPLGPSRYKFKSMTRSTSNASEADSDYIDFTRMKFKPFGESSNAYNNEKTVAMKPASRSLKPQVPRARTAGSAWKSSKHQHHPESLHSSVSSGGGGGGVLPSIEQLTSINAEIPSASLEKDHPAGGSSSLLAPERSIALSDTSSFYFNYSEDESDHKYLPATARFRNNNKSPPRPDRRVRTAPAPAGPASSADITVNAQPVQLAAASSRGRKKSVSGEGSSSLVDSTTLHASTLSTTGTVSLVPGGPPQLPTAPTLEESLSLLDIHLTQTLAPPLPGTHLLSTNQVKSKLQKLHSTDIKGVDMLLVGNPANAADTVTVMKASPGPPLVVRPSSGSASSSRPSPRVKGLAQPVAAQLPITYFGGPPPPNPVPVSLTGGIADDAHYDARLELRSAHKTTRQ